MQHRELLVVYSVIRQRQAFVRENLRIPVALRFLGQLCPAALNGVRQGLTVMDCASPYVDVLYGASPDGWSGLTQTRWSFPAIAGKKASTTPVAAAEFQSAVAGEAVDLTRIN